LAQVTDLFPLLNSWLDGHAEKIDRAYLSFRDEGISFIVIQKSMELDRNLDESILDLDIKIAGDDEFNAIRLEVLVLPFCSEEAVRSFIRPTGTMRKQFS
jgi:hypothetical protein